MVMVCPEEKRVYYREHFAEWVASSHMTVQQLESAVGMAQYMSEGFPEGAAHVAPLLELLRKADAWEGSVLGRERERAARLLTALDGGGARVGAVRAARVDGGA